MKALICVTCLAAASVVFLLAGDSWEGKPFTGWDEKECASVLTKSPWAFSNSFGDVGSLGMIETGGRGEREQKVTLRFRFLSAKPVRMAFARLRSIKEPGGATEEKLREIVSNPADPQNRIAIQIEFTVDPPSHAELRRIHSFLLNASLAQLRDDTRLETSNKVILAPVEYLPPTKDRPNASLIFNRVDEKGQVLFTGEEKWIAFKTEITGYKVYYRLKPDKMQFEGKFEM